jgi:hypothetical protein
MPRKPKSQHERLIEFINDDTLSGDTALLAAAICLMESTELCKEMRDTDGLIRTANAWYDIAKTLLGISDTDEDKKPFGFAAVELAEVGEDEDDEPGDDPRAGGIKIRKESW